MKNFFGSIFINRDELREAGIEYPIKVEYYKITNEIPSRQKLIFGIQVIKTEYKEKIGVEQRKIENITNSEKEVDKILYQLKENEVTPIGLEDVLIELGNGFAFVGNQYKLTVSNKDYFIDLLFYHLKLKCYIVVELKAREFEPTDAGQLNFYLSAIDDLVKDENDNPSIGLLLCKTKDKFTAEYALKDINKPIGVSEYKLLEDIPEYLQSQLPKAEDIELHIKEIE